MKIPQETIDQIRAASDVVDVISRYVRLKKRGKDYLGLCPFHSEKTPSFSVSPSKQLFYCFGCHKGGDVVKFVMEYEKSSYVEALEELAEKSHAAARRLLSRLLLSHKILRIYLKLFDHSNSFAGIPPICPKSSVR